MAIGNPPEPARGPAGPAGARLSERGLGRLAAWCYDHRRRVLAGWVLAVVAVIGLAQWAGSRLDNNFAFAGSPSQQAQDLLASRFPSQRGDSAEVVLRSPAPLDSPANAAAIGRLAGSLRLLAHVAGAQSPLAPGGSGQLSAERRIGFVAVHFDAPAAELPAAAVRQVIGTARGFSRPGLQVALGGAPIEQVVSAAPGSAEMIGLVAAVVMTLLAFGSVVAMGLPILAALAGVGMGLVGLGFMDGLALSTIVAVALVLAAALTLLPATFGFAGSAIDRLHIPGLLARPGPATGPGWWSRWSETVQRRPLACAAAALALLAVLAVPLFSMRQAFSDAGNDPASFTTRQAYDLLASGFGPGFNGPLVVAAELRDPQAPTTIARLGARLGHTPGVASVAPPVIYAARDAAVIVVYPATAPQSAQTASLVHRLRDQVIPQVADRSGVTAYVGGETAAGVDTSAYLSGRLPWVIGTVILLAFFLLMMVFRSVMIPIKAAAMNLLSMGTAYGVIVAVYQWGWLGSVFGASRAGPIDPWIPLMIFTIVFGLSMDYEVFLLSRMREEWLRSGENSRAVTHGLASSARVVTAAAAVMICVFGSFVIGDPLRILGVFGLGLAAAVLIDATVVRVVLVPAVMQLLGPANWWLPRWAGPAPASSATEPDENDLTGGLVRARPATRNQLVRRP